MLRLRQNPVPVLGQSTAPPAQPQQAPNNIALAALLLAIAGLSVAIGGVSLITERSAER